MSDPPTVSIVINTDGRAALLGQVLSSLRYLRYPRFEVVVVPGPTADGTRELLRAWQGQVKTGDCPLRNIALSRNIGIEIASGEFIAFIDDDEIPEPEWLDDLMPAMADPRVAVAGGFLHDHTGKGYQSRYETVNRFGAADQSVQRATPEFNFPLSFNFPHAMINSPFRRSAIVDIGGFDEEFEYYLDETDLICRMIDRGWRVAQLDRGFVHHKFMPSRIRNPQRVLTSWYLVTKSRMYFALVNGGKFAPRAEVSAAVARWVDEMRRGVHWAVREKMLEAAAIDRFEHEVAQALRDGAARAEGGVRRLGDPARLQGDRDGFLPFPTLLPAARQRCLVFAAAAFPPAAPDGAGRRALRRARAAAHHGHQVHVLTRGTEHDRVDFEDGVWVHRIVLRRFPVPQAGIGADLPAYLWNHSMTMLAEAQEIAARRPVDCVVAPLRGVEGIAFLRDGRFNLVSDAQQPIAQYCEINPERRADPTYMTRVAAPVAAAEQALVAGSAGLIAAGEAVVGALEAARGIPLERTRIVTPPCEIDDWSGLPDAPPPAPPAGTVRLLFVGRLETGKGIGALLGLAPELLAGLPQLRLDILGNDRVPGPDGRSWRVAFADDHGSEPSCARIAFHGEVGEERLRGFYRAADIVVAPALGGAPSHVQLEAMMMGKPVVAWRTSAAREVIEDGRTGLLVPVGDGGALSDAIGRLAGDGALRQRIGAAARAEYLGRFAGNGGAAAQVDFLLRLAAVAQTAIAAGGG